MKKMMLIVCMLLVGSMAMADVNAETLAALKANHKQAMENYGYAHIWNETNSFFTTNDGKLVSVVRLGLEYSFYTEYKDYKIHTHLSLKKGVNPGELIFNFDNKITKGGSTYDLNFEYVFSFGSKPGFKVRTNIDSRWDWALCWNCIKCAGDNIGELYNAWQECGTNFTCWVNKFQHLVDLYNCMINNCVPCFKAE